MQHLASGKPPLDKRVSYLIMFPKPRMTGNSLDPWTERIGHYGKISKLLVKSCTGQLRRAFPTRAESRDRRRLVVLHLRRQQFRTSSATRIILRELQLW